MMKMLTVKYLVGSCRVLPDNIWTTSTITLSDAHGTTLTYAIIDAAPLGRVGQVTPLHVASTFGHMDMVRWLVERGADVRCKDTYGLTPMHRAAKVQLPPA